jgi:hypothetical protein
VEAGSSPTGVPFRVTMIVRPIKRRRFVPRAAIADAAGKAAKIDAAQFRADLDAVVDPRPYD